MKSARTQLVEKSKAFSVRIVNMCTFLRRERDEHVLSKQLLRSGTSVGANISEAVYAQSKADFVAKMQIALKEINETGYWLDLLHKTDYLSDREFLSIFSDQQELIKILTAIVKSAKR
ncbi:MAG: four helix bundle protein [Alistipes sp.]|nr:four helix bundle protein [Alistipes sp.]